MKIRTAHDTDVDAIVALRRKRSDWLRRLGSDQWQETGLDDDVFRRRVRESTDAGETFVAEHDNRTVGTIAVDGWAHPGMWRDDLLADSLVVHRMITDPDPALRHAPFERLLGAGLGRQLLDTAVDCARRQGKWWLRLDAWTTSTNLHRYYQRQGFTACGVVPNHHTQSAALFARPVDVPIEATPNQTLPAEPTDDGYPGGASSTICRPIRVHHPHEPAPCRGQRDDHNLLLCSNELPAPMYWDTSLDAWRLQDGPDWGPGTRPVFPDAVVTRLPDLTFHTGGRYQVRCNTDGITMRCEAEPFSGRRIPGGDQVDVYARVARSAREVLSPM